MDRAEALRNGKSDADRWWLKSKSRILAKQHIERMKKATPPASIESQEK